uniref:ATPase AAA-type core domain-containing protein n=1 Tax=Ananas comosus var. bracteatus TaxID=296719 RepID=A0A6V7Q1U0_ANACO|nr:unnamed protein product [Ananas comosus var. bracteatus]
MTSQTYCFQRLKEAERQRIEKLEKFEKKADMQLERQLIMASCWSRTLLTLQGKLKGTEWDPENSHRIDFSEFWRLLNSNNVQFMEYSNFGQTISVGIYLLIDSVTRPIYAKLIPCDLGKPEKKARQPLKRCALGSLGKSRAKFISAEETTGVTFDDFAGQEYIKRELQEIVRILKNEDEFQDKGIYCPKGVLLHGPPGTGKTLLLKLLRVKQDFLSLLQTVLILLR